MPSVGFEPTIPAGERPQTYALVRAVTGSGTLVRRLAKITGHKTLSIYHKIKQLYYTVINMNISNNFERDELSVCVCYGNKTCKKNSKNIVRNTR